MSNNPYFDMINDIIELDRRKAEAENLETNRLLYEMGYPVKCITCGDFACLGDYTHYES